MNRNVVSFVLVLALMIGLLPMTAFAQPAVDLSDCDILYDGEGWKVFPVENKEDSLNVADLNITLVDKDGQEIPSDAYELMFGTFIWDDVKQEDNFTPIEEPFSLTMNDDYMHSGFGGFAAYAVAKENSGYTGQAEPREFMLWHTYSFNWFGANADFGEEYKGQCMWSWHDFFEIPADEMHAPVIHGIAFEDVDPQYYEITYFERGEQPSFDDPEYDQKLYPETDPLEDLPTDEGKYFATIVGKEPYYGTSYVDFDIVSAPESFALVRGSDRRYYDGDIIYLHKDEELYICFKMEPYKDWIIPGWRNDLLKEDGFTVDDDPSFFDGEDSTYVHVKADGMSAGDIGTLYYSWCRFEDVFDEHGGMHWDTAEPVLSCSVILEVMPDEYDYLLGDADGDGDITIMDVTILQRHLAGSPVNVSKSVLMQGDVDEDDDLSIADANLIQRRLANIRIPYHVGKPIVLK